MFPSQAVGKGLGERLPGAQLHTDMVGEGC